MNKTNIGFSALAQGLSKDQYKAAKQKITAEYAADKTACDSLSGNTKDSCLTQAKANFGKV